MAVDQAATGANAGEAAKASVSVAVRLARQRKRRLSGCTEDIDEEDEVSLAELVEHFKLARFAGALEEMGVESSGDLAYLQDSDLEKIGMPMVPRRKLLEAACGEWRMHDDDREGPRADRSSGQPAEQSQAAKGSPAADASAAAQAKSEVAAHPGDSAELQQVLSDCPDLIEEFSDVNALGPGERAQLAALPPRIALRTMGLLGKDNSFVMHGVRKPGAAMYSRSRTASAEESQGCASHPYEDWQRLLEDFAEANDVSDRVLSKLQDLDRAKALQVMGFTSKLAFAVPGDTCDAEAEIEARLRAALSERPMVPVVARGGPRQVSRAMPVPKAPSKRPRSQSREPAPRQVRSTGPSRSSDDPAPCWRKNLETFVQLNDVDERSARVLSELPKMQALQVMGLAGRENSFVIRGARNPSAAVMHRLQKAQEGRGSHEMYGNLARLIEDFISVNEFDDRGVDALRTLRREVALDVMGFTCDNTFVIHSAKNPSAALMARIQTAQRLHPASR